LVSLPSYGQGYDWENINTGFDPERIVNYAALSSINQGTEFQIMNKVDTTSDVAATLSISGGQLILESTYDIRLLPLGNTVIEMATEVRFLPNSTGPKIKYYQDSYQVAVEAFTLVQQSDQDFEWRSDTINNLMDLTESGDLSTLQDITAGRDIIATDDVIATDIFQHSSDSVGDKYRLYSTAYKMGISPNDFDFTTDYFFKWHSDINDDAMVLDGDTGNLTLEGGWVIGGTANAANQVIQNATEIQATKFNFRGVWDEPTEAALKAKLNNGDTVYFIKNGDPISLYLGVKYEGELRVQELVLYADRVTGHQYAMATKQFDEIYLIRTHIPT